MVSSFPRVAFEVNAYCSRSEVSFPENTTLLRTFALAIRITVPQALHASQISFPQTHLHMAAHSF
jgi:hypothetical protein